MKQIRKAAAKKRKATIARKKREAEREAARAAKEAERAAQAKAREEARMAAREARQAAIEAAAADKAERKTLLVQARKTFKYKVKAWKRKQEVMRRQLRLPKDRQKFTPEQRERWNALVLQSRKELDVWLVERMRKELAKSARAEARTERIESVAEAMAAKEKRLKEREERRRLLREKYGFTLGKKPVTPEEIAGRRRYDLDLMAAGRERNREKIRAYNSEYRRKRRAAALAVKQEKWTPEQWAAWERRQKTKERGTPGWLVKEVARGIASERGISPDKAMKMLLERGGIDFLMAGAEAIGRQRCMGKSIVPAAIRAVEFYLDPDLAAMFGVK